jgi:hypothetical protein
MRTRTDPGVPSYEFVVPGRPVSVQGRSRAARRDWTEKVQVAAIRNSPATPPFFEPGVRLTLVHLCLLGPIDADNIIKPIQDALEGIFYPDDRVITDVDSHRRMMKERGLVARLPPILLAAWMAGRECVYVRVQTSIPLEAYL